MGVRGLSTFFNNNPDLMKPFKLHDTTIIIDGNNLIHLLYFRSKVDCMYGGDYNRYSSSVQKYFSSYLECHIKPIVIFDGGYDTSNRKLRTNLLRSKSRLTLTQQIAKYGDCAGNVLPINAQEVFRCVLSEMNIPFAQCDFEADDQVTALANYYQCPVLSDDSDFFIFDVKKGFIRLSSVETAVCLGTANDGFQFKYLKCDIYYIDKFLSFFPGIDRSVLPLFGTLVGNDFANTKDFETFFSNIQLPKQKYKGLKINQGQRRIIGLLSWLQCYNLEEGIKQVICRLKKERREKVKYMIDNSVNGYRIESCNLIHVLNGDASLCSKELMLNSRIILPCGKKLPIQFIISFHQGSLPSFFLNVVNLHRIFLPAQVENTHLESSFVCSRYIRQILYGILLQHEFANSEEHTNLCLKSVEEYDRRCGSVQRFLVEPIFNLANGNPLPMLNHLYDLEEDYLHDLLLDVIDCQKSFIFLLPNNLKLLFGSIIYWLKNCTPAPCEEFLYALILCVIHLNLLLPKSKEVIQKKMERCSDDFKNIRSLVKTISSSDALAATKNMKKYLQKPTFNRANPLILHIVHSYSQFQTCVLYISYLNMLLRSPFENPKLHECLCGTMIYNLTKEILSRPYPDLFVSEILGRQSNVAILFNTLKDELLRNVPCESYVKIDRSENQTKKSCSIKKKSQIQKTSEKCDPNVELNYNEFGQLSLFDGELNGDCTEVYI